MTTKKIIAILWIAGFFFCCKSRTEKNENHITATEINADTVPVIKKDLDGVKNTGTAWLIVPGKSIGKTELNENADLVYKRLGKPDGGDAAMGKAVAIWFANHDSKGHSTSIYTIMDMGNSDTALIKQIRVTSPAFKTSEGLGVGSSLPDIEKAFNVTVVETFSDSGKKYQVHDTEKGIAFEIGPDKKCVAVIVHEAVKHVSDSYLKLRATNQYINKTKQ